MQISRIREYDETDKFAIKPSPLGKQHFLGVHQIHG